MPLRTGLVCASSRSVLHTLYSPWPPCSGESPDRCITSEDYSVQFREMHPRLTQLPMQLIAASQYSPLHSLYRSPRSSTTTYARYSVLRTSLAEEAQGNKDAFNLKTHIINTSRHHHHTITITINFEQWRSHHHSYPAIVATTQWQQSISAIWSSRRLHPSTSAMNYTIMMNTTLNHHQLSTMSASTSTFSLTTNRVPPQS